MGNDYINLGTQGSVQLRGGIVPEAGTVEYCVSGTWKPVCDGYRWAYTNAFVVCRQLGFPATGMLLSVLLFSLRHVNHPCSYTSLFFSNVIVMTALTPKNTLSRRIS